MTSRNVLAAFNSNDCTGIPVYVNMDQVTPCSVEETRSCEPASGSLTVGISAKLTCMPGAEETAVSMMGPGTYLRQTWHSFSNCTGPTSYTYWPLDVCITSRLAKTNSLRWAFDRSKSSCFSTNYVGSNCEDGPGELKKEYLPNGECDAEWMRIEVFNNNTPDTLPVSIASGSSINVAGIAASAVAGIALVALVSLFVYRRVYYSKVSEQTPTQGPNELESTQRNSPFNAPFLNAESINSHEETACSDETLQITMPAGKDLPEQALPKPVEKFSQLFSAFSADLGGEPATDALEKSEDKEKPFLTSSSDADAVQPSSPGASSIARLPDDPFTWTVQQTASWILQVTGSAQTASLAIGEQVDGVALFRLTEEHMVHGLGIQTIGQRARLEAAIERLKPTSFSDSVTDAPPSYDADLN
ncbi:hypothetical protein HDU77_010182 [Chytriomyces hyalinus]|nr:hypothetical protein HDU77_010182 [Chytriomyces hyalinus]